MPEITSGQKVLLGLKELFSLLFCCVSPLGIGYSLYTKNWDWAMWCLCLDVPCVIIYVAHKFYMKDELHLKFTARFFRITKFVAIFFAVGLCCAFIAHIAVSVNRKEDFDPDKLLSPNSYVIRSNTVAGVIAFLAAAWNLVLFFEARKYEGLLTS